MLNHWVGAGRLTRPPEMRYTPTGKPVTSFTIAVDRPFKNAQGEKETDFVDCVCWNKLAEVAAQHLDKGIMAGVEGRLQIRTYENQEGQKRKVAEIIAERIHFLDKKKDGQPAPAQQSQTPDLGNLDLSDLPF